MVVQVNRTTVPSSLQSVKQCNQQLEKVQQRRARTSCKGRGGSSQQRCTAWQRSVAMWNTVGLAASLGPISPPMPAAAVPNRGSCFSLCECGRSCSSSLIPSALYDGKHHVRHSKQQLHYRITARARHKACFMIQAVRCRCCSCKKKSVYLDRQVKAADDADSGLVHIALQAGRIRRMWPEYPFYGGTRRAVRQQPLQGPDDECCEGRTETRSRFALSDCSHNGTHAVRS